MKTIKRVTLYAPYKYAFFGNNEIYGELVKEDKNKLIIKRIIVLYIDGLESKTNEEITYIKKNLLGWKIESELEYKNMKKNLNQCRNAIKEEKMEETISIFKRWRK